MSRVSKTCVSGKSHDHRLNMVILRFSGIRMPGRVSSSVNEQWLNARKSFLPESITSSVDWVSIRQILE